MSKNSFMLFSGTSHRGLAEEITRYLGIDLGEVLIEKFPDGEIGVQILENVRGRDIFVVQTIARDPNFYLMELLILIDALRRASAHHIVAVIPYFGYSRQDRKDKGRVPITAKLVANLLEVAGVNRVVTMDLHAGQIQGFFDIPVDNLYARSVLVDKIRTLQLENPVVVTPDIGSIKLARAFAHDLQADFAIIDKRRLNSMQVEIGGIMGDVRGRDVLLVDDICATGETLKSASFLCRKGGARKIIAAVSHAHLLGEAIEESEINQLLLTNSIPLAKKIDHSLIQVVSVGELFAKAIQHIVDHESIKALFQ